MNYIFSNPSVECSHPKADKVIHIPTSRRECISVHIYTQKDTRCQGEGRPWKMQACELWQLCPQRLASGPIWQHAHHTHSRTPTCIYIHTCQLHLLREPTEHCWAKMSLAAESSEDSLEWTSKVCFFNPKYLLHGLSFVLILIADSWYTYLN